MEAVGVIAPGGSIPGGMVCGIASPCGITVFCGIACGSIWGTGWTGRTMSTVVFDISIPGCVFGTPGRVGILASGETPALGTFGRAGTVEADGSVLDSTGIGVPGTEGKAGVEAGKEDGEGKAGTEVTGAAVGDGMILAIFAATGFISAVTPACRNCSMRR